MKDYPVHTVDVDTGETIAYRTAGEKGPIVVLLHGNMSSSVHFQIVMERLELHCQVYALDMVGFGDSTYNRTLSSLKDFSEDVVAFLKKMSIEKCFVLGWSMGGGVAMEVAAALPTVVQGVFLASSVGMKGYPMYKKNEQMMPILTERIYERSEIAVDPVQVLPILHAYQTNNRDFMKMVWDATIYPNQKPDAETYEKYLDATFQQRNLVDVDVALANFNATEEEIDGRVGSGIINQITVPVWVLHGTSDRVVPLEQAQQTKEILNEQAALFVLEGAGHDLFIDQLDAVTECILERVL